MFRSPRRLPPVTMVVVAVIVPRVSAEGERDPGAINRVGIIVVVRIVGVVRTATIVEGGTAAVVTVVIATIIVTAAVISVVVVMMVVAGLRRSRNGEAGKSHTTKDEIAENVHRTSRLSIYLTGRRPLLFTPTESNVASRMRVLQGFKRHDWHLHC